MAWIWMIVIGFVVGILAKLIVPGKNEPQGFILTTILGIAGSFVGTYAGRFLGLYAEGQTTGFIGSVVGAVILIFVYQFATKKR